MTDHMRFRTKHIADSVVERIQAISQAVAAGTTVSPPVRVQIERGPDGRMNAIVKTLKDGTQERIEVGNPIGGSPPAGLVKVAELDTDTESEQNELPGLDESGLDIGTVLGGGDSIDAALKS